MDKPEMGKEMSLAGKELPQQFIADLSERRAMQILDYDPPKAGEKGIIDPKDFDFEKLYLESNLLPIRFIREGNRRADAICRLNARFNLGTGFLVGPGLLMTNNHLIASPEEAKEFVAEFYYEEGVDTIRVTLHPEKLFITSDKFDLDYTIVACSVDGIEQATPITLCREPALIALGERANIIQHPKGRFKEIAIHENKVVYIDQKVIHYTTDTETGSSGAPSFNDDWELVALHHAGWQNEEGKTVNEGVRISAIVADLMRRVTQGAAYADAAKKMLRHVNGYTEAMGFFDLAGLVEPGDDQFEVEVLNYKGTREYVDAGFWNIEHFNDKISDSRVREVSKVVKTLSLDVFGLTEVQDGALMRLQKELRKGGVNTDFVYLPSNYAQGMAVLYDADLVKCFMRNDIYDRYADLLNSTVDGGKPAFAGGRLPLFAQCIVRDGAKESRFIFIVLHLKAFGDALSRSRRKLASQIVAAIIEDIQSEEKLPVILGGDFNQVLDGDVLASLTGDPDLFTLTSDDHQEDAMTYVGNPKYQSVIDHIIVSKDTQLGEIEADDAAIVRLDKELAIFTKEISDHVPVVVRILYKDTTGAGDNDLPMAGGGDEKPEASASDPCKETTSTAAEKEEDLAAIGAIKAKLNKTKFKVEKEYYDPELDTKTAEAYYKGIPLNDLKGGELFQALHRLLKQTHERFLSYGEARHSYLYPIVDLWPDGQLHSIYSGEKMDPEDAIRRDFEAARKIRREFERFTRFESFATDNEKADFLAALESQFPFNCEHVVPQSWFNKSNPMRADLHHLFACEPKCNSHRSNYRYKDFEDFAPQVEDPFEKLKRQCGKADGSRFEPEAGKGYVARATLYFILRYPNSTQYKEKDLKTLLKWHKDFPVDPFDLHRNFHIQRAQGNRNPFIDFPDLADVVDFEQGV